MTKKTIDEIQQIPMDGYQVANQMRGLKPGDEGYNDSWLATEAYREMRFAGWKFSAYHFDFGTEIWAPPSCPTCKDTGIAPWCSGDGRCYCDGRKCPCINCSNKL